MPSASSISPDYCPICLELRRINQVCTCRAHTHTRTYKRNTYTCTNTCTNSLTDTHTQTPTPTHTHTHTHTHLRGGGGSPGHHVLPVCHRTRQSVFFPHDFLLLSPPPPLPGVASSLPGDYLPPLSLCLTYLPL